MSDETINTDNNISETYDVMSILKNQIGSPLYREWENQNLLINNTDNYTKEEVINDHIED